MADGETNMKQIFFTLNSIGAYPRLCDSISFRRDENDGKRR